MAKEYIDGESKDQRKARKRKEKEAKEQKGVEQPVPPVPPVQPSPVIQQTKKESSQKNYIVCLKHGTKYSSEYVNRLYNMVNRHTTVPFEFVCFTDDTRGIKDGIKTIPLKQIGIYGWWYKIIFFDKDFPLQGNILYFDLDVVVYKNIDNLFYFQPDKFVICRDFNRSLRKDWSRMNSSVFRLTSKSLPFVYDEFMSRHDYHIRRFHGDQDWIYNEVSPKKEKWTFWPDEWIQSYKWEMRDRKDLQKIDGVRNFIKEADPVLLENCSVAVFHGEPHPHQCNDKWVVDNWK